MDVHVCHIGWCALCSQPLEHVDTLGHETALRTQHPRLIPTK